MKTNAGEHRLNPDLCERMLVEKNLKRGSLFSAMLFKNTELGFMWAQLQAQAAQTFPRLKIKKYQDLHITIIYIGRNWKFSDLEKIWGVASVPPIQYPKFSFSLEKFGYGERVLALEVHRIPQSWANRIILAKQRANEMGLRIPDLYDSTFRAHITLGEIRNANPTPEDREELENFKRWVLERIKVDDLRIVSDNSIELLLAGASRPEDGPDYISVDDFIKLHFEKP